MKMLAIAAAFAVLLPASAHAVEYTVAASPRTHCDGVTACNAEAFCPAGLFPYGGGVIGDQAKIESSYVIQIGNDRGWRASFRGAFFEYGVTAHGNATAYVICGPNPGGYTTSVSLFQSCTENIHGSCAAAAVCPSGWTLLSGGVDGNQSQLEYSASEGNDQWVATWYPDAGDFGASVNSNARAYAICGHASPQDLTPWQEDPQTCTVDGPSCTSTATCPIGQVVIGGGFYGIESKIESMGPVSATTWKATWYPATEELGASAAGIGAAVAYCATGSAPDSLFGDGFD